MGNTCTTVTEEEAQKDSPVQGTMVGAAAMQSFEPACAPQVPQVPPETRLRSAHRHRKAAEVNSSRNPHSPRTTTGQPWSNSATSSMCWTSTVHGAFTTVNHPSSCEGVSGQLLVSEDNCGCEVGEPVTSPLGGIAKSSTPPPHHINLTVVPASTMCAA